MGTKKWEHPKVTKNQALEMIKVTEEELLERVSVAKAVHKDNLCDREAAREATNQGLVSNGWVYKKICERLKRLRIARHKIQEGDISWGICKICKEPIPKPRLKMYPEKNKCVYCLKEYKSQHTDTGLFFGKHILKNSGLPIERLTPTSPL